MGIHDFLEIFDQLDSAQRGFLSLEQIIEFHSTICEREIREDLIQLSLERVCGTNKHTVSRGLFFDVVSEIERRYAVDDEAYWDFNALDANGDDHIALTDALLLFQEYHGDQFSLSTWHKFLQCREEPAVDVYFNEIRNWLSEVPPDCKPSSQKDIRKEEARLEQMSNEESFRQLDKLKNLFGNEDLEREANDERLETLHHQSRRKLNIWRTHGLAAMLHHADEYGFVGDDIDSDRAMQREGIYISDVLEALDMKYSMLQEKILTEMASYAANMDSEKSEIFQQLKKSLVRIANSQAFNDRVQDLPGAKMLLPMTLLGMMGDLRDANNGRKSDFDRLRQDLEQNGKSESEINSILDSKYQDVISGSSSCGSTLAQLRLRHKAERELILSVLEKKDGSVPPTVALAHEYCLLLRQLRLLKSEADITPAGLSVGVAERRQTYKSSIFDWDRQRSETLSSLRLDAHRGHRLLRRSANLPDIDSIKVMNSISLRVRLVEEIEQQHFYEREALIHWLQGPDSEKILSSATRMNDEERKKRIRILRSQRHELKSSSNPDLDVNQKILQEAISLYYEDRLSEIEIKQHNAGADVVKTAVLSDLQQMQEIQFYKLMEEIHNKSLAELQTTVLQEIEATRDEHFNNIALVLLGGIEISAGDAEFINSLDRKYKAMRDQVLVFGLMERLGSSWKDLSKEDKQREILKVRKDEQRLRREGDVHKLNSLIGPLSQALPHLRSLVGEDKILSVSPTKPPTVPAPVNLLADLISRQDEEKEMLLLWLKSDEAKALLGRVRRIQISRMAMEKFAASMEADYETAMLFVGLLERVGSVISGRSYSDKEHQYSLAKKRAVLHQKVMNKQEKAKQPPEEKSTPKDDDDNGWQAVYLRALLRRHHKEREIMLRLLLENGLGELVEAAALMSPDEARARIKELQMKRSQLDLNEDGMQEENMNILEEAGAIRVAGKKQVLCKASGKAVDLDTVVHHLLAELQDLQDIELATALSQLPSLAAQVLQTKTTQEDLARKNGHGDLVMKLFIKYDIDTNVALFEQLIEEKYGKLRIHLLNESLSQQHGSKAWAKMNTKQKSKLLQPLMSKEATTWTDGTSENLCACLYAEFSLDPSFPFLIGMGPGLYHHALQSAQPEEMIPEESHVHLDSHGSRETISELHRRFLGEMDFMRNYISGSLENIPTETQKTVLLYNLKWELNLIQMSSNFQEATLFTGLAERENGSKSQSLQHDRARAEFLSGLISQSKKEMPKKLPDVVKSEDVNAVQETVLTLLMRKHLEEWGIFKQLFSSSNFEETRQLTAVETEQQRSDRLLALLHQRQLCDMKNTSNQLTILEEALVVKKECRRHELKDDSSDIDNSKIMVSLMSDLIQMQLSEASAYMQAFSDETEEDAEESQVTLFGEITEGHVTNIAEIIFNTKGEEVGENQLKEAIDGKYDALRDQLLIQALIDQLGEDKWKRLSEKERQRLLMELKLKERQLRREGRYDELNALLGGLALDEDRLRKLLGDDKEEQERKLRERLERRKKRLAEGMTEEECDELEAQEIAQEQEEEKERKKNILLYLEKCNDKEKEDLLRRLGEMEDEHMKQRQRQLEMLRLRREQRILREEDKFDAAAMVMGLSHDNDERLRLSREEELKRQQELARQRLEAARQRRLQGENLIRGESLVLYTGEENEATANERALKMMDHRHEVERNILIQILDDATEGDERDEARIMTEDELQQGLKETEELYNLWKDSANSKKDDRKKILDSSAALSMELKKRNMQAEGDLASDEDVKVTLLAELQMEQEKEASSLIKLLTDADGDRKNSIVVSQEQKLNQGHCDNIINVLMALADEKDMFTEEKENDEGADENEKAVVKALEKKYDAMKDKLIMEALMKEMGEADWSRLSDLEKQRKILEFKRKERRLRLEGKFDEAAALLGQFEDTTNELNRLLGESEEQQRRLIQEKLEMKRKLKEQREAEGLATDEETLDELVEEEVKKKRRNVLENLDLRLEEEKAAILASLHNQTDRLQKERERQLALAKLKRDEKRLKQEETFDSAAMIFAMHQESNEKLAQHIESERERQRQLAKARIEARKRQKAGGAPEDIDAIDEEITDDDVYLQESIKSCLENIHSDERDLLMSMFTPSIEKNNKKLMKMKDQDLKLQLMKLQNEYETWERNMMKSVSEGDSTQLSDKKKKKLEKDRQKRRQHLEKILEQTLAYKSELERRQLKSNGNEDSLEKMNEDILLKFLADLQLKQLASLESMCDSLSEKNTNDLRDAHKIIKSMAKESWYKTLCMSMFGASAEGDGAAGDDDQMESQMLEEEFEMAKKSLLEKGERENIDISALMKNLEMEHEQRRQALLASHERQRKALKQRRLAKKNASDDKDWDMSVMTNQIFATNQANKESANQMLKDETGRQQSLLQQRLQARRDARKQAEREKESMNSRESSSMSNASTTRNKKRSIDQSVLPKGLRREMTVVDVDMSDDSKKAVYDKLVQQELKWQQEMQDQYSKQAEMVKRLREERANKHKNEAAALMSLGERQKTILEKSKQDDRERQTAQMQEKVTRLRQSRSKSPKTSTIPE